MIKETPPVVSLRSFVTCIQDFNDHCYEVQYQNLFRDDNMVEVRGQKRLYIDLCLKVYMPKLGTPFGNSIYAKTANKELFDGKGISLEEKNIILQMTEEYERVKKVVLYEEDYPSLLGYESVFYIGSHPNHVMHHYLVLVNHFVEE